jgi:hypothetical protein
MTTLQRRLRKLEAEIPDSHAMMQDNDSKPADLSMLSMEELEVLQKVLHYTLEREAAAPTGKRPLVADPSGLSADDMVIYRRMAECAERRLNGIVLIRHARTVTRTGTIRARYR